jgi:hypothetical protein
MSKVYVDTDLLREKAQKILEPGEETFTSGELMMEGIQAVCSSYPQLIRDAANDALSVNNDPLHGLTPRGNRLVELGKELKQLADRFDAVDRQTIEWLQQQIMKLMESAFYLISIADYIHSLNPDIVLFSAPQTRMVTSGSVSIRVGDPNNPSRRIWVKTGEFIPNIIGTYKDPKTGQEFYVVIVDYDKDGNPILGYLPITDNISQPLSSMDIPLRQGPFADGQEGDPNDCTYPWGQGTWPQLWIDERWWEGGPAQDFILGDCMKEGEPYGMGFTGFRCSPNHNLCGELCKMESVGATDIRGELEKFMNKVPSGESILKKDGLTGQAEIIAFFKVNGYSAVAGVGAMPTPSELAQGLADGKKYMFATDLDTKTGKLSTTGEHAPHWVTVKAVFQDEKGDYFVEVYNPYTNTTQVYSWETFVATCKNPGSYKNEAGERVKQTGPVYVVASPSDAESNTKSN